MSVDGIGGGGRRPLGGPGSSEPAGAGQVDLHAGAGVGAAGSGEIREAAPGSVSLGALQRGEIDLGAYLDGRVLEATRHLESNLSAEQLEFVRGGLRDQLSSDPVLVELVRRTTSRVSTPRAE
jgi:hypothetical protein